MVVIVIANMTEIVMNSLTYESLKEIFDGEKKDLESFLHEKKRKQTKNIKLLILILFDIIYYYIK